MNASSRFTRIWVRQYHLGIIVLVLVGLLVSLAIVSNDGGSSPSDAATRFLMAEPIPIKPLKPRPVPSPPNTKKAALKQTTECLQGVPHLKVDTRGGNPVDLQVSFSDDIGDGKAQVAVFSSHEQAVKYSQSSKSVTVGNLAAAIFTHRGTVNFQNFQNAVEPCLG